MRATALVERHRALGARMVEFAGWEMPVQYRGILEEHRAVRQRAGVFDLSHMGELHVRGPQAGAALAYALVTDPPALAVGRAHYSMICAPDGGVIDDLIVYRLAPEHFLVVANAGNAEVVANELRARLAGFDAALDDASLRTSLVAIQGPRALGVLAPLTDVDPGALRYYAIGEGRVAGIPGLVARTGYTGEDGFECFVPWEDGPAVFDALLAAGAAEDVIPAGLGARDTLRLEAGMPLYGNELGRDTTPFDAGLGRVVKFGKAGDFVGREALAAAQDRGRSKALVGLVVRGRGIARHGYPVHEQGAGAPCGAVTSGTQSPTLGEPIAMAYVPPRDAEVGTMLEVAIREARVPAEVVALPFYRRPA
ncbi:MAG: glycine cleavage system aminomethyltransferase GcvT [Candidatus Limnocylindrales bacterium]